MLIYFIKTVQYRFTWLSSSDLTRSAVMPTTIPDPSPARQHRLRSGTAARLAGLPVSTLRVWERRYGVVAAAKTESGQRVYSPHDISRLRLLRQLTHAGHAIGTIATLELESLQALISGMPALAHEVAIAALDAVVVGRSAAHALEAVPGCVLRAVHDDLDQAESAPAPDGRVGLLLVRLASLQPRAVDRVLALGAALRAGAIFVVYGFGTEASAGSLREAGATVRREPLAARELAQWVRDAREAPASAGSAAVEAGWQVASRRFSDESLARLMQMPSPVACECLRHMAEIVAQLAGFERYSQDCISTGPADAALHRHLNRTAGAARTMFEQALQRIVDDEGLELRDESNR
jgi:MerR family transcriptional regulator, light-induced transcriptional regulator